MTRKSTEAVPHEENMASASRGSAPVSGDPAQDNQEDDIALPLPVEDGDPDAQAV